MHPDRTPKYLAHKRREAAQAIQWHKPLEEGGDDMTYRAIALRLGYNHPQSIVELIKNYGETEESK